MRVAGVCRPSDPYTACEREHARALQRTLAALQVHADAMRRWRVGHCRPGAESRTLDAAAGLGITPREVAVLSFCAEGMTTASAARRLGISPRTAEKHLENAYRKLGVQDRVSALRRSHRWIAVDRARARKGDSGLHQ